MSIKIRCSVFYPDKCSQYFQYAWCKTHYMQHYMQMSKMFFMLNTKVESHFLITSEVCVWWNNLPKGQVNHKISHWYQNDIPNESQKEIFLDDIKLMSICCHFDIILTPCERVSKRFSVGIISFWYQCDIFWLMCPLG